MLRVGGSVRCAEIHETEFDVRRSGVDSVESKSGWVVHGTAGV